MNCPECQHEFTAKRPHQRFCSNKCRVDNYAGNDGGLRGTVSAVRKRKGDTVSVTVVFPADAAHNALQIALGACIEVVT